ncbi:MAG: dihydrolipoyl dehydrogenase [Dysgonamonadaceae bacterium]|jgi:dihydrolipoamide dehydrogenase|nr:dihydrolipoyl dehydrogenase [Dysgonamonadaceae bacterium]
MIYDLAIIGGGPAGYTAAELAGMSGLKTVLFEKNALGGVCLNEGCIPTKSLLYSAKLFTHAKDASKYGVRSDATIIDPAVIFSRKNKIIRKLVAGIKYKLQNAGVDQVMGNAEVLSATDDEISIACSGINYTAHKLLLCTGSETVIPPIPGLAETEFWTSREALDNKLIPESLLIIGGGVIGMEFASYFNSIGTNVLVVEMLDEILPGFDCELASHLRNEYAKKGVQFYLQTKVTAIESGRVLLEHAGITTPLHAEKLLLCIGRKPVLSGFGLENMQLERTHNGLKVNKFMQTSRSNIYACGDITGFSMLAHTAVHEAETAIEHILGHSRSANYTTVPSVVYTDPEIAGVGKTEEMLQKEGITYHVKKLPMSYSGRFVVENELANGICKILISDDDTILGMHLLGNPASELIVIGGIAIAHKLKTAALRSMIFPHPTVGEIIKETLK